MGQDQSSFLTEVAVANALERRYNSSAGKKSMRVNNCPTCETVSKCFKMRTCSANELVNIFSSDNIPRYINIFKNNSFKKRMYCRLIILGIKSGNDNQTYIGIIFSNRINWYILKNNITTRDINDMILQREIPFSPYKLAESMKNFINKYKDRELKVMSYIKLYEDDDTYGFAKDFFADKMLVNHTWNMEKNYLTDEWFISINKYHLIKHQDWSYGYFINTKIVLSP